jgi:hypothetical protein
MADFGPDGFGAYFQAHTDGKIFVETDSETRVAAFMQAQRELEAAVGKTIPAAASVVTDRVRLDYACYELAMHLIKCAATPGSGGSVPSYIGASKGDAEASREAPRPHVWPESVWRWLGGSPRVVLSRG